MKSIHTTQNFFPLKDGNELFFRTYHPAKAKGVIIVVHGMGEHSGRYDHFARYLADHGWTLYLYDLRGHGKSPGIRVFIEKFQDYIEDLYQFIRMIQKKEAEERIFLLGHSFGAQICINFLSQHPREVKGAILSSPNIRLALKVPKLKQTLGQVLSNFLPSLSVANDIDPKAISHDQAVVDKYREDKLVQDKITLRLGSEMLKNLDQIFHLAPKIKTPCLVFHGSGDRITSPQATEEFFEYMTVKDRELKIYPGFLHETLNEIGKERVYEDIARWLNLRVA